MEDILIIPIGKIESDILTDISTAIEKIFHCRIEIGKGISVPRNSYHTRRRQYHSTDILKEMHALRKKVSEKMLGLTDVDLYVHDLNFVFGEADIAAGIAVISLSRLKQEFYGLPPDIKLFHERAVKESIHELGHTYGFNHCNNPRCIMYFSNTLRDTDVKGPGFCNICKERLGISGNNKALSGKG